MSVPAAATGNRWVLRYPAPEASVRLFCFPYAGAGASVFRSWAALLPPWVELCAVQLPGRETRVAEPPRRRLDDLVREASAALAPLLDPPYAFFGHSLGALLAFEVCRAFRQAGWPLPQQLLVSAHAAPQLAYLRRLLSRLPDPQLLQELRRYQGTPEAVLQNAELMRLLLPVVRADFELLDTYAYSPEPALEIPICAFAALDDTEVRFADVAAWREQTVTTFGLRQYLGGHLFLLRSAADVVNAVCNELGPLAGGIPAQYF